MDAGEALQYFATLETGSDPEFHAYSSEEDPDDGSAGEESSENDGGISEVVGDDGDDGDVDCEQEVSPAAGTMRYVRADGKVYVQWKGSKVVTMLSTYHKATQHAMVERRAKDKHTGQWKAIQVSTPHVIYSYNQRGNVQRNAPLAIATCTPRDTTASWNTISDESVTASASGILFSCHSVNNVEVHLSG